MVDKVDLTSLEISTDQLRWKCDPVSLGFDCTDQLDGPNTFIGQQRAVEALEFGLGVERAGFNIFVTGLTGTGRTSVIKTHLKQIVKARAAEFGENPVCDWCYVANFSHPEQPTPIQVSAGQGREFANATAELLEVLKKDLQAAFKSDAYREQTSALTERVTEQRQAMFSNADNTARDNGFALQPNPAGISIIPLDGAKPMDQALLLALGEEEKQQMEDRRKVVAEVVEKSLKRVQALEAEATQEGREAGEFIAKATIEAPFEAINAQFVDNTGIVEFLAELKNYTLNNLPPFFSEKQESSNGETE